MPEMSPTSSISRSTELRSSMPGSATTAAPEAEISRVAPRCSRLRSLTDLLTRSRGRPRLSPSPLYLAISDLLSKGSTEPWPPRPSRCHAIGLAGARPRHASRQARTECGPLRNSLAPRFRTNTDNSFPASRAGIRASAVAGRRTSSCGNCLMNGVLAGGSQRDRDHVRLKTRGRGVKYVKIRISFLNGSGL